LELGLYIYAYIIDEGVYVMLGGLKLNKTIIYIVIVTVVLLVVSLSTYLITGVVLKSDLPIVRNLCTPEVVPPASMDGYNIAATWIDAKPYVPIPYKTLFQEGETEEQFYTRMADVDRRSLYQLIQKYPGLLQNGLSKISFDLTQNPVSDVLDSESAEKLKVDLQAGAVKTKQGHTIIAIDGTKSMMLVSVSINQTDGYMAISYDKSKLMLSVTKTATEGWWGTMDDHIKQNDGAVVAIPANNYTYNAKACYGVVDGGFNNNNIARYKMSSNMDFYMGFSRDGMFTVGDQARFGNINFSEGLGMLLQDGVVPVTEVVPAFEQKQLFDALATYIKATGQNPEAEGYDGVPVITSFIEAFDSNLMRAKAAWVIKNKTLVEAIEKKLIPEDTTDINAYTATMEAEAGASQELKDAARLVAACDNLGASQYVQIAVPFRSAYNAIGQRASDGATVLFGIGGAKKADSRNLPGNGVTVEEMQELFLTYGLTNATVTTSGDRVGFGWKDQSMLHVQDTTRKGGNSYGAYILK